jgi:hypothetical protein
MKNTFEEELLSIGMLTVTKTLLEKAKQDKGVKECEKRIKDSVLNLSMNHSQQLLKILDKIK